VRIAQVSLLLGAPCPPCICGVSLSPTATFSCSVATQVMMVTVREGGGERVCVCERERVCVRESVRESVCERNTHTHTHDIYTDREVYYVIARMRIPAPSQQQACGFQQHSSSMWIPTALLKHVDSNSTPQAQNPEDRANFVPFPAMVDSK
jgi:hypothetical protein